MYRLFFSLDATRSRTPSPNNAKASVTETRENPKKDNGEESDLNKGGDAPSHADIISRYKRLVSARSQASASSEATTADEAVESNSGENKSEISNSPQTIVAEETTQVGEPSVMSTCDDLEEEQTEKGKLSCLRSSRECTFSLLNFK